MGVCSIVRFRWRQDRLESFNHPTASWAIDNVYIGMQCESHCNGHGTCISGMLCLCDDGYTGEHCTSDTPRPNFLKEDFERWFHLNVLVSLQLKSSCQILKLVCI